MEAFTTGCDETFDLVFGGKFCLYQSDGVSSGGWVMSHHLDEPDRAKRVTLMFVTRSDGVAVPMFDGTTGDHFTVQLLLTAEAPSPKGGVFAFALDANGGAADGKITPLLALRSGGYEGVENESGGNGWLVEAVRGAGDTAPGGKSGRCLSAVIDLGRRFV